jgi:hypothetical protein
LVEQRIENPRVLGSIPRLATKFKRLPVVFSTGSRFSLLLRLRHCVQPHSAADHLTGRLRMGGIAPGKPTYCLKIIAPKPEVTGQMKN